MALDLTTARLAIKELTDQCVGFKNFVSAEYEGGDRFLLRFAGGVPKDTPGVVKLSLFNGLREIELLVDAVSTTGVAPAIGFVEQHPPRSANNEIVGEMGGDQCRASGDMTRYGTLSFYAANATFTVSGGCNHSMTTAPVLISNNHVIARSDMAPIGEPIWTPSLGVVAVLDNFVPIRCTADLAFARVTEWYSIRSCQIRSIGGIIPTARPPQLGELIRKHGARTGYTAGRVEAVASINVGGIMRHGVFRTSRGFGCPGDSGSAVIGRDQTVIGLFSWVEIRPCENDPYGYFFALTTEAAFTDDSANALAIIA